MRFLPWQLFRKWVNQRKCETPGLHCFKKAHTHLSRQPPYQHLPALVSSLELVRKFISYANALTNANATRLLYTASRKLTLPLVISLLTSISLRPGTDALMRFYQSFCKSVNQRKCETPGSYFKKVYCLDLNGNSYPSVIVSMSAEGCVMGLCCLDVHCLRGNGHPDNRDPAPVMWPLFQCVGSRQCLQCVHGTP